jgi:hypothetical protein
MANWLPVVVVNGEFQQLQPGDMLLVQQAGIKFQPVTGTQFGVIDTGSGWLTVTGSNSNPAVESALVLSASNDLFNRAIVYLGSRGSITSFPKIGYVALLGQGSGFVFSGLTIGSGNIPRAMLDVYGSALFSGGVNIGGTTDPGAGKLYLAGSGQNYVEFRSSTDTHGWIIGRSIAGTNSNDLFIYNFATAPATVAFGIFNSGCVYIGGNASGQFDAGAGTLVLGPTPAAGASPQASRLLLLTDSGATHQRMLSLREGSNAAYGFDWTLDDISTGDMRLYVVRTGTSYLVMNFSRANGDITLGSAGTGSSVKQLILQGESGTGGGFQITAFANASIAWAMGTENVIAGTGSNTKLLFYTPTSTFRMYGLGAGTMTTDASGNIIISSNEKLKENIKPFIRGLKDLLNLQPITYHWTKASGYDTVNEYTGFGSLQTKQHIPEAVSDTLTFSDRPIIAALVNAMREINQRLKQLEYANA